VSESRDPVRTIDHAPAAADSTAGPDRTGPYAPGEPPPAGLPPAPPGFEVLGELGRGGMGVVYQARQVALNRVVALKMVLGAGADEKARVRFLAEAEAVAAVRHPHVVEVYEYGEHAGRPYFAMEFLPGGSLAAAVAKAGRLPPADAAALAEKLARGVQAAHDTGVVHRDLKPGNVLFDEHGEPKVTDFGLVKRAASDLTATQAVMGTPAYMAPEQAGGKAKYVGPAADVWALGVILYECLTGSPPFRGDDTWSVLRQVIADDPPPPRAAAAVPRDLELICLKCLRKDPADRYPSAAALADDLGRFLRREPISVRPAGPLERGYKWVRRNPARATAVLAAALAGFAATVGVLWRKAETAKGEAETTRDQLAEQKWKVEEARDKLAEAERALVRQKYFRDVDLAHREWRGNNVQRARALLDQCPADLRGWEWGYVDRLLRPEALVLRGHTKPVRAVDVSPDGTRIATASDDGTAKVWDAATGTLIHSVTGSSGWLIFPKIVMAAPCDLAALGATAFLPGGRLLTVSETGTLTVWDAATGKRVTGRYISVNHLDWLRAVTVSPDGRWVFTGVGKVVRAWDAMTLAPGPTLDGKTGDVVCLAVSPDPSRTTVFVGTREGVRVWEPGGNLNPDPNAVIEEFASIGALAPLNHRDVVVRADGTVRLHNAENNKFGPVLPHAEPVHGLAAGGPGRRRLATVGDGPVRVWEDFRTEILTLRGHVGPVNAAAFTPDGRRLVTGGDDGTARVWDLRDGGTLAVTLPKASAAARAVAVLPGGRWAVTAPPYINQIERPPCVVWDLAARASARFLAGHTQEVNAVAAVPGTTRVVTAGEDGTAKVWDAATGALIHTLTGHTADPDRLFAHARVRWVAVTPDGRRAVTAAFDETVRAWDLGTGGQLRVLPTGYADTFALHPDGTRVATLDAVLDKESEVRVWDVATGASVATFRTSARRLDQRHHMYMTYTPDGARLVIAGPDGVARVYDAGTGAELLALRGHTGKVTAVAVSPDGGRILTGSEDRTAKLWDAETGAEVLTLVSHTREVQAVAFSPDGRLILTGGTDTTRVWDAGPAFARPPEP
jgi:WD40 repeat protein